MLTVGVITAPRSKQNYLSASLDSYFRIWDYTPTIFAEPKTPLPRFHNRVNWIENKVQLGVVSNWFSTLGYLYTNNLHAKYFMMCEDDIEWKKLAGYEVRTILLTERVQTKAKRYDLPNIGFLSPYCSRMNGGELYDNVWQEAIMQKWGWCGALSLILPRESVKIILDSRASFYKHAANQTHDGRPRHLDHAIGEVLFRENHRPLIARMPSMVKHLGVEDSTVGHLPPTQFPEHIRRAREALE